MCQLTMMDIDPKTKLGKATIRSLTELNSIPIIKESPQANTDGFGYMTFAKAPEIVKSFDSAIEWWNKNWENYQKSVRNPNGIYHVRSASYNSSKLYDRDAHPFIHNHIVVAHNGTMTESNKLKDDEKLQKIFEEDQHDFIDSEKFCIVLSQICGENKLTKKNIISAMEYFHGPFALLIYDTKQPTKVFVVRGKDRPLHKAEIFSDKEHKVRVGIVINSQLFELTYWAKQLKMIAKEFSGLSLEIGVVPLEEEKIYEYKIGSYSLENPVATIIQSSAPFVSTVKHYAGTNNVVNHSTISSSSLGAMEIYKTIYTLSSELKLSFIEMQILSEYTLGHAMHISSTGELEYLVLILNKLKGYDYKGRVKEWEAFLKDNKIQPLMGYKTSGISFPFMLSSRKVIRSKANKAKVLPTI